VKGIALRFSEWSFNFYLARDDSTSGISLEQDDRIVFFAASGEAGTRRRLNINPFGLFVQRTGLAIKSLARLSVSADVAVKTNTQTS